VFTSRRLCPEKVAKLLHNGAVFSPLDSQPNEVYNAQSEVGGTTKVAGVSGVFHKLQTLPVGFVSYPCAIYSGADQLKP